MKVIPCPFQKVKGPLSPRGGERDEKVRINVHHPSKY